MADVKTIDNLGLQTYIRYEEERSRFGDDILIHAQEVASELTRDVSNPLLFSEFDLLFDLQKRARPWADILPPPTYKDQRRRLFTHQLAPKLGPEERVEAYQDRIEQVRDQLKKKIAENKALVTATKPEEEEMVKDAEKLILLMQDINGFNKMIDYAYKERNRYSKG